MTLTLEAMLAAAPKSPTVSGIPAAATGKNRQGQNSTASASSAAQEATPRVGDTYNVYYDLMGARIDLERLGCNSVCLETIKRVEAYLAPQQTDGNGGWLSMDTAPRDGTLVLVWNGDEKTGSAYIAKWECGNWFNNHYGDREPVWHLANPRMWQPLPFLSKINEAKGGT